MMIQLELLVNSPAQEYAEQEDVSRIKFATRKTSQEKKDRRK